MTSHPCTGRLPLCEPLENRLMMRLTGIDVSLYQGTMDWTKAASTGISFAMIRASRTDTVPDSQVSTNVPAAKAAGLQVGVYHRILPFSKTDDSGAFVDPIVDADNFFASGGAYMGSGFIRPIVDVENGMALNTTPVNGYDLSGWVLAFANRIKSLTGATPLIYSGHYRSYLSNAVVSALPDLWVANWNTTAYGNPVTGTGSPPISPWSSWKFWQYSSTGSGAAYGASSTNIDLDVFNGDAAALQTFVRTPAPEVNVFQGSALVMDGQSAPINFGTITNGGTTSSISFTVKNWGSQTLNLSNLSVPTGYTITNNLVASLAAGASDTITIRLDNAASGAKTGVLSFTSNDADEATYNFNLTGTVLPKAPTSLVVNGSTSSTVTLGWTDVSDETQFQIERKTGAGGTYAQIGTAAAGATSYVDNTATPGVTYYYRVRDSVANATVFSSYSNEVNTTTLANVPTTLVATDGTTNSAVHITWSAATGAASYAIFRSSTNNSGSAAQIGTTTNLFYDDSTVAGDTVAYYWVKALNSASQASGFSNGDSGYRDPTAPTVVSTQLDLDVLPQKLVIKFSENVINSLSSSDVSVQDQDDLQKPAFSPSNWSYDAATNTATFNFSSSTPLADSDYRATIAATDVFDPANNKLPAALTFDFFTLSGDGNHDGVVNISDFNILAGNFGKPLVKYSEGNFDYSTGNIDIKDFNVLAANFGRTMPRTQSLAAKSSSADSGSRNAIVLPVATVAQGVTKTDDDLLLRDTGLL